MYIYRFYECSCRPLDTDKSIFSISERSREIEEVVDVNIVKRLYR